MAKIEIKTYQMKHLLYLFLLSTFSYSQNYQIHKIVVDKNTKIPLENVIVFNETDNSTTNTDGEFIFVSKKTKLT